MVALSNDEVERGGKYGFRYVEGDVVSWETGHSCSWNDDEMKDRGIILYFKANKSYYFPCFR